MMKYCVYCGCELNDDAEYCTSCGKVQNNNEKNVVKQSQSSGLGFGIAAICLFWFPVLPFVFSIIAFIKGIKSNKLSTIACACIALFLAIVYRVIIMIVCITLGFSWIYKIFADHCEFNADGNFYCK